MDGSFDMWFSFYSGVDREGFWSLKFGDASDSATPAVRMGCKILESGAGGLVSPRLVSSRRIEVDLGVYTGNWITM